MPQTFNCWSTNPNSKNREPLKIREPSVFTLERAKAIRAEHALVGS